MIMVKKLYGQLSYAAKESRKMGGHIEEGLLYLIRYEISLEIHYYPTGEDELSSLWRTGSPSRTFS
jgi:hypothetical protein